MKSVVDKKNTSLWILVNVIKLTLISQVHSAYYTYTKENETLHNLYFDPSNHLEGDCITKEAQGYYYYFGRRNKNYQSSFLRGRCANWENVRIIFTNRVKFYKKSKKKSLREKVKDLNLSNVDWGSSGYWKHNECRSVRLSKNHPYYKAKGVWNENKKITNNNETRNANEKYRAGWNFGPWCFVIVNSFSLRKSLLKEKIDHSWYLNTTVDTEFYPMACFPICTKKEKKRISNFALEKRKTNMIFNRRAINNINKHFFKSFHFGMMQYYRKKSDRIHSSDDFITFYKTSMWAGFIVIIFTVFIVYVCYRLDKYEEKLENGENLDDDVDSIENFFKFQNDNDVEEQKETLRDVLLKCQEIQIERLANLANEQTLN